jgi:hypothetical protein
MRWPALSLAIVLSGCASASGPPAAAVAVDVDDVSAAALAGSRTVWVAAAVSRTGTQASGSGDPESAPPAESSDVRDSLTSAVRSQRGLELASDRDAADLVLYFEQADRLHCWGCQQPENLWYWWGLVLDPSGRELASLHGETEGGAPAAARQFVESVASITRSRHAR